MNEAQGLKKWPDTVSGTTLGAMSFQVIVNESAPTNSLASASAVFAKDGAITLTPTVTITSAANWQFTVGPVAASSMDLEEGIHVGDLLTVDSAGIEKKYVKTEIKILPSPR